MGGWWGHRVRPEGRKPPPTPRLGRDELEGRDWGTGQETTLSVLVEEEA